MAAAALVLRVQHEGQSVSEHRRMSWPAIWGSAPRPQLAPQIVRVRAIIGRRARDRHVYRRTDWSVAFTWHTDVLQFSDNSRCPVLWIGPNIGHDKSEDMTLDDLVGTPSGSSISNRG